MDLLASRLEKGAWQKPVNLGARINTPGDEVFPFIHEDGTLFFASNGWSSLGGLDVFMATGRCRTKWFSLVSGPPNQSYLFDAIDIWYVKIMLPLRATTG